MKTEPAPFHFPGPAGTISDSDEVRINREAAFDLSHTTGLTLPENVVVDEAS
jgi:hypothetical protein